MKKKNTSVKLGTRLSSRDQQILKSYNGLPTPGMHG